MATLRFTGQDEIPLLASAINLCSPMEPSVLDVAMLREEVAHGDLWWPGCLVAEEEGKVVAVLTTARREWKARVRRLRIHPDYRLKGLGRQMLTLLMERLAQNGVRLLSAEAPCDGSERFFQGLGFRAMGSLTDYIQQFPLESLIAPEQVEVMTVNEALAFPGLWRAEPLAWIRTYPSLHAASGRLDALCLTARNKVVAALIFDADPYENVTNIWRFGWMTGPHQGASLSLLVRVLKDRAKGPLRIPKLSDSELPRYLVDRWGFVPSGSFVYLECCTDPERFPEDAGGEDEPV